MNIASDTASREMLDKEQVHQSQKAYEFFRRFRDIVISTLALIFLSPLMLAIVIAIRLESPQGKAIFSQTRCGKDGKEFTFYKFRSMCVDAEEKKKAVLAEAKAKADEILAAAKKEAEEAAEAAKPISVEEAINMIKNGECGVFSEKMLRCFEASAEDFRNAVEGEHS